MRRPGGAERVAAACASQVFRPYTTHEVVGTEICGATKNVVGLAVGMAEGMGFGDNTKATIITRGLAETTRLGLALGAEPQTFWGWLASATSSPRACHRSRATTPSASSSVVV